ncbi:MAG TPA: immunoglobulin-like domain-containing protein [Verrucomicrobiae bacterium]|nr:immunoglobulin-like domain-containing protein [Verrucomicrobiae bacterium]
MTGDQWNNIDVSSGTGISLIYASGGNSPATITFTSVGGYDVNAFDGSTPFAGTPYDALMECYLYSAGVPQTITLSGLTANSIYNLVLFNAADVPAAGRTSYFTVNGNTQTSTWNGSSSTLIAGIDYVEFPSASSDASGNMVITWAGNGSLEGDINGFQIQFVQGPPPTITTLPATAAVNSNATLNATLNLNTLAVSVWFQWGLTNNPYSSQTTPVIVAGGITNSVLAFSNNVTGLTPGLIYHCRAVATNVDGLANGDDVLFGSPPVVTLFGAASITNECHTVFTDPGATNTLGLPVIETGRVYTNDPNIYQLTYTTATNSLGLAGAAIRLVTVVDTTPPVITMLGANPLVILTGTPFVDPGATALDACGGSFLVTASNNINPAVAGGYVVTYSSTDDYNNTATVERTVVVRRPQLTFVTTTNDNGDGSLRQAIANSYSGDTIQFATNLSGSTILLTSGQLTLSNSFVGNYLLTNSLTIDASALSAGIAIDGNGTSRVFEVTNDATVTLNSLTISNGEANNSLTFGGGGILNFGALTLANCTLAGNHADYVSNSFSSDGGGGIYNSGTLTLVNCTLAGNHADYGNDGAYPGGGGGIFNSPYRTVTLNQCTLTGNQADYGAPTGGGIFNSGTVTLNQCILSGNHADHGLTNEYYSGRGGGGIYNSGTLTVNQSTLDGNHADYGGELPVDTSQGDSGGGGICNDTFANLTLNECTLAGNHADNNPYGGGGGIANFGTNTLNQCTLTGNHADTNLDGGGGAIFSYDATLTVNQSTLTGNLAQGSGPNPEFGGGGICDIHDQYDPQAGLATIYNSIVAGNDAIAGSGPDIYSNSTNFFLRGADIVDQLIGIDPGATLINAAPLLAPLGNYGGPTQTMPPLPGSPAVDACDDTVFTTDQRGFPRVLDLTPDIGSVEGVYNTNGPGILTGMTRLGGGATWFMFTNYTDASSTVLAGTNLALPLNLWTDLGPAVESPIGSGQYQFTDPQATNLPQRFYRVRVP